MRGGAIFELSTVYECVEVFPRGKICLGAIVSRGPDLPIRTLEWPQES